MTACDLCFEPCILNHNCSVTLSPYFWDNKTIEGYIQKSSGVPEASELKDMLDMAKQNKEKQGMFAYKEEFDEEGGSWDENVWSKRLTARFIVSNPYTVEYTGDKGNHIYRNRLLYHRFHGASDLIIRKYDDERGVATLATEESSDSDSDDSNSQDTTVATVENSVKVEGKLKDTVLDRVILGKSGELLSNMHV